MSANTETPREIAPSIALLAAALIGTVVSFSPAHSILPLGLGDGTLLALIALHFAWALQLGTESLRGRSPDRAHLAVTAEALFFFAAFLFLFAYVYASNANMDYVQRFVADGGVIQLAPDTRTERLLVAGRYGPFLLVDLLLWIWARTRSRGVAPILMLLSVALSVSSYPSFFSVTGVPVLGWVSLVPLFVLIRREVSRRRPGRAIWYGVLYGVLFTLVGNYWLGTFNLISLQAVGAIFLGFYLLYMPIPVGVLHMLEALRRRGSGTPWSRLPRVTLALVLPLSWTAFELARSSGFLGYPWLLAAHSQYQVPVMIQTARIGGVWMVSFLVLLVNAFLAEAILSLIERRPAPRRRGVPWIVAAAVVVAGNAFFGVTTLNRNPDYTATTTDNTARIALIQQNSDPRKHDYRRTLGSLTELTDRALVADPDLVVWSETAFVPNIRRWSAEDPDRYYLARLVQEFLLYLETVNAWLLTGNDDYRRRLDEDGTELSRDNYNAAVLFSAGNRRQDTYHKVKLVPFTEYFPYREQLPWVYDMLMSVDITFWSPGMEFTVFHHPKFDFATPICFEDVFPRVVRTFAHEGMQVIVNITNDYWSLQEQAARQHMAAALFRTVELGMPMVRSTASGVTSHIDDQGRIVATVPQYSEQFLIADVTIPPETNPKTLYYRWGDWFPPVALATLAALLVLNYVGSGRIWRRRHETLVSEKK